MVLVANKSLSYLILSYNLFSTNQSNDTLKNLSSHTPIRFTTEIRLYGRRGGEVETVGGGGSHIF